MQEKTMIFIALILGGAIVAYALINSYSYQIYQEKQLNAERQLKDDERKRRIDEENWKRQSIISCRKDAEDLYWSNWNRTCQKSGLDDGCSLPTNNAKNIEKIRDDGIADCIKLYE